MSSTTQCPACGTLFKVAVEQLKTTKGWVRCGQCQEVFDALRYTPDALAAQEPAHGLKVTFYADSHSTVPQSTVPQDSQAPLAVTHNAPSPDVETTSKPPAPRARKKSSNKKLTSLEYAHSGGLSAERRFERWANSGYPGESRPRPISEPAPIDVPTYQAPSFVTQAQRQQFWRSPWVRTSMGLLGLLLLSTLGLQVLRHERDRIAAAAPATLPWLQSLCSMSGCTVGLLKQIDAVVIDASSFNKLRSEGGSDLYKLGLSLKNTGQLAVSMPHIELSLNDAQDQPLLRRVLSPQDFGSVQNVLAPITEFAGGTTIAVDSKQLAGARIAGYRVWAFYP